MSTQQQIVGADILLEFLEVAFHNILYVRNLYPKEIFVRKQIYGIATQVSEHPELNTYLKEVLNSIRELIRHDENSVRKINLCFYNQDKTPVEQFVFDLGKLKADLAVHDPFFLKTEEALRTFCLKLSTSGSYLKRLPENATFSIQIHTHEAAHAALNENPRCENFPWIEAEEDMTEIKEQTLLPLKSINTEYLNLQMYALEKENKNEEKQ
ncbi:mitotic spindle assembly checkpoint protein MAD2B [Neodiprion fabricii]|uniref:mitotic spindle assembly checkpoint protein MAD2B n=1 Tax=Neodiprion fabricii TaxID=2872261 RepID=UPI001ED93F6A|nr:mitotic spindle assembly checkpoint protein MAD2B [Neodiprion fabricii]